MQAGTRPNNLKVVHLMSSRLDYVREADKLGWKIQTRSENLAPKT
jgi:hypothetical protein